MSRHAAARVCASAGASLGEVMAAMAPQGVRVGCRVIGEGDAAHLLPEEMRAITARDPLARCASGAARRLARGLLAELGHPGACIGRARSGGPVWPAGVTGSLAHDEEMAVAAVASVSAVRGLGIDVEPAEALPDDVSTLVVTDADVAGAMDRRLAGRLLFACKEAVYKAVHPLDDVILGYDDIAVDLAAATARTRTGHLARLSLCVLPRIVALAIVPHAPIPRLHRSHR